MIAILGGGLAGMSTAYHLARQLPEVPRVILEKSSQPGGLAVSQRVGDFTFDLTGHYLHLRDPEIRAWVEELLPGVMQPVARRARIHSHGARLEFPFQANLFGLPPAVVARCLIDAAEAFRHAAPPQDGRMPFGKWARQVFGDGIAEEFMIPYNTKLFLTDPDEITAEWVAWSVPRPDLAQIVRGALGLANAGLGYNPQFLYPKDGGIGVLPRALAGRVADDLRLGAEVVSIDARERRIVLQGGETIAFDQVVSTLPLPYLLQRTRGIDGCPGRGSKTLAEIAGALRWTAVLDLELGVDRPEIADGAHWIYFPEARYRFYRVGFPSNVCRAMAPAGCSSLSIEYAHRPGTPVPAIEELIADARRGLEEAGILAPHDRIVAQHLAVLDPAYVLFDERRTPYVEEALRVLAQAGIHSVGRFGEWTYSYMERALLDGKRASNAVCERIAARVGKG